MKLDMIGIRKVVGSNLILPYLVKESENNCISAPINTSESTTFCSSCDLSAILNRLYGVILLPNVESAFL